MGLGVFRSCGLLPHSPLLGQNRPQCKADSRRRDLRSSGRWVKVDSWLSTPLRDRNALGEAILGRMVVMPWARIEGSAYWICLVVMFLVVAIWESFQPKRELSSPAGRRWKNHGVMLVIAAAVSTVLLRVSPVVLAVAVAGSRFGVLNKPWPPLIVRCGITVALLDLLQYWIHWSFHHVPWLWRIHQVHHSDPDYDVSTAARFHPLEVLCSQGIRFGAITLLAPPAAGVFIAELLSVILNFSAHANASLPERIEKTLRSVFVTPDWHRIHHSQEIGEQNRNFGQTFPWWDHFFGTYANTASAHNGVFRTGLAGLEECDALGIGFMLAEPFRAYNKRVRTRVRTPSPEKLRLLLARTQHKRSADEQANGGHAR